MDFAPLKLPKGARVLVVSRDGAAITRHLEARDLKPTVLAPTSPLAVQPGSFEAAVVIDALERFEWDRWLLQQVRRALVPGAPLLLEARNLWSLASPLDALGLAGRIGGLFAQRAWNAIATPPPDAPPPNRKFRGRRYRGERLAAMLERLGFAIESSTGGGAGRAWTIVAHARERTLDCDALVAQFERENASFLEARAAWLRAHPAQAPARTQKLEPSSYAGRTALVLSPHPDDEIIGPGGTLLRLVDAGCRVTVVQATDGSDGWSVRGLPEEEKRTVRLEEARRVAEAAGFRDVDWWRESNRSFRATDAMIARLAALIRKLEPALVFTPFLADAHRDHRTLNAILAGAILASGDALADSTILGYEVWSLAPPSLACDVTQVRERQEALLRQYEHAMRVDDFLEMCERRNAYHACTLFHQKGAYEVFHAAVPAEYPGLVAHAFQRSP